jgi:hypothetical protein
MRRSTIGVPLCLVSKVDPCASHFVYYSVINCHWEWLRRVGQARLELATPRLSSACSNQLSYWPGGRWIGLSRPNSEQIVIVGLTRGTDPKVTSCLQKGGDPTAGSPTVTLLRLHPSYQSLFRRLPHEVGAPTSRATDSHGVTGGVYKARERIHRSVLICDY